MMYRAARAWGIQPSEFWAMSTAEWLTEADAKMQEIDNMPLPGHRSLTRRDKREIEADLLLSDEEWWAKHG